MVSRLGGTATGALSGAGTGFAVGGPIGAGIGGLVGAIGGFLSSGNKDQFRSVLNPQQRALQQQLIGQAQQMAQPGGSYDLSQQYLKGLLSNDPNAFNQFSSPYLQQFEQQVLPRLTERFAGLGGGLGGGVHGSSGFGQAIGGAASDYQAKLQQLWQGLRNQAAQQAIGQYNQLGSFGLQQTQAYQPGTLGFGASSLAGLSQGVGQGFGQRLGYNMGQRFGGDQSGNSDQFSPQDYQMMDAIRQQYYGA
jgi:hypothetical protein